jgi:two-component system, OmpR family, sensor histidine kinase KdpD
MEHYKRKTPEEMLYSISKLHQGKLKIFIGPVSGSGKTYHMLREGQALRQKGIDVVICAVSTLQRPETVEQLGDLERVPSVHWSKDGTEYKDLNIDELVKRNPEVVLVDGLAHRNRPESRFRTRLEDIAFLQSQGISVITTVNVYELEGYMEVAQKMTGIEVPYTVPADTLELADEVTLIDVTPEMVLERLAEGHLKADKDEAVFKRGNLSVLRELALRLVAGEVNGTLEEHRTEMGYHGPSGAAECILVSTQYHWNGSIYVRRGHQIAKRLNGKLLVVTWRNFEKPLSKEASAFRRSIMKLVRKLEGALEELPFRSRKSVPKLLAHYAMTHHVTRIVMGHSRHTRWQELWQGSIVTGLIRITKSIDVLLVADRAEFEGERILPAAMEAAEGLRDYRRLSSQQVAEQIERIKRGKLKVYIGAAPGVGKTYTMLRDGNDLLKKGIDVRIGLLETHGREETILQVGALPAISRQEISYRDVILEEMDLEAILESRPEVVLIDELAHTNVPGSRNRKRYEDVLDIINAGISVITTVNVQHLESLNDAVGQITGIRVRETVPDSILRTADEVQLIDVSPQTLQDRMREGKIYAMKKVDQALSNFFRTGNLIALRELALREIADDVDERLESIERKSSLRGPWRRKEVIFVCVNLAPHAERLIRRGFRTAYRLKAAWYVNYVNPVPVISPEQQKRILALEGLTRQLGGTFLLHSCSSPKEIVEVLSSKAEELGTTQLVVGQPKLTLLEEWSRGAVVNRLLRRSRHMDVLIVADLASAGL